MHRRRKVSSVTSFTFEYASDPWKAIIVGGGPAGLSTALRLHQTTDISCSIYELRPEPTTLGGALSILSNGLRLFHRLGVYDTLLSRGSSNSNVVIRSIEGSVLGEQDVVGWAREQTGFGLLRTKRTDLLDVLLDAVQRAGIPIHYNKKLTAIEEDQRGITASFFDGTSDTADLLLGCDGIHSSVRRLYVDPLQVPEYSGFAGLTALIPSSVLSESAASRLKGINPTLTHEGMFTTVSCAALDDEIYWVFSRQTPLPETGDVRDGWEVRRKEEVQGFKSTLAGLLENASGEWGDILKDIIQNTSAVQFYPVYKLPLGASWYKGRCMLLGDAAHAIQPQASQGVSMAIEDAFLLSRLLKDPGRSLGDIFETFDRIRRPRVDEIASLAARNAVSKEKSGPWGFWFKQHAIWVVMWVFWALGLGRLGLGQKHLVYDIEEEEL